jgi:hypothetical protein
MARPRLKPEILAEDDIDSPKPSARARLDYKMLDERDQSDRPLYLPGRYHPTYPAVAFKLGLLGLTTSQQADIFGVTSQAFHNWTIRYPLFGAAVNDSATLADAEIAYAQFQLATGYRHVSEMVVFDSKTGECRRTEIIKQYAPDGQTGRKWLMNRRRGKEGLQWLDTQQHELSGPGGTPLPSGNPPVVLQIIGVGPAPDPDPADDIVEG